MREQKGYSRTIFTKLVIFTIITSILPTTFLCAILFDQIKDMTEREIMESYNQFSYQYLRNIEEKLVQYENSIGFISENTIIVESIENQEEGIYRRGDKISEEVFKSLLLDNQIELRNCMVYSMKEDNPVYGTSAAMMSAAKQETWYQFYEGQIGEWFYYPVYSNKNKTVASLVQNINKINVNELGQEVLGIVKLDVYIDRLFAPANLEKRSFEVVVYDKDHKIWYSSDESKNHQLTDIVEQDIKNLDMNFHGVSKIKDRIIFHSKVNTFDLNVMLIFEKSELTQKRRELAGMLFPIFFIVIGTVTIGAYLFANKFSKRINILVHKFKTAETGNLEITAPIPGDDEITVLDVQFNEMLNQLNKLIQKNYVQELEKKETELKNLQLQINPHFLYNTLETISSISAVQHVFVVCDICQKLGEIFRYSLGKNHGEFVTVEQEIHHVQNYIFIQKLRYGNKFEVFYNIEPGTEKCTILRFILQPIVENAILHGLDPMTGCGTLEITVEKKEDILIIRIEDDGVGMDITKKEELLNYINQQNSKTDDKKSIGVRNVNRRIKLVFGDEYGIKIESDIYSGSSFMITFPLKMEGEDHV